MIIKCISNNGFNFYTQGKIYTVNNGYINDDHNKLRLIYDYEKKEFIGMAKWEIYQPLTVEKSLEVYKRNSKHKEYEKHYKNYNIEPIKVIQDWKLNFNLGNVVKYIARAEIKGNKKQDLEKALNYLKYELESL